MASRTSQKTGGSVKSARLEEVLDKLVAVQMDLKPICRVSGEGATVVAASDAIAGGCTILHSAIADLRNMIHQIDGQRDLPGATPEHD
jgi:hypothetical protein